MRCARVLEKGIIMAILVFYTNTKHSENKRIIANLSLHANTQHRMEKERKLIEGGKPRMADYANTNKPTAHLPNLHMYIGRTLCKI